MSIVLRGVVHGKNIELKNDLGIAEGQEVEVVVRLVKPSAQWDDGILRSAGAAADVQGFDEMFQQIERERKAAKFRDAGP